MVDLVADAGLRTRAVLWASALFFLPLPGLKGTDATSLIREVDVVVFFVCFLK